MSSTSASNGVVQIQVTFEIGTNVDNAALNVNNRVKQVEPRLPQEVRRQGVTVEKRLVGVPAGARVLLARRPLRRPVHVELRDAERARPAEAVPGTTNVQIFGAQGLRDAHLAEARPPGAAASSRPPTSIARDQRAERAVRRRQGRPGARPAAARTSSTPITTQGRLAEPKEFEQIIVRAEPRRLDGAAGATSRASSSARRTTTSSAASTASRRRSSASSCSPAPTRSTSRRRSRPMARARDALPAGPRPTRCRTTRRASSRCRSAKW